MHVLCYFGTKGLSKYTYFVGLTTFKGIFSLNVRPSKNIPYNIVNPIEHSYLHTIRNIVINYSLVLVLNMDLAVVETLEYPFVTKFII